MPDAPNRRLRRLCKLTRISTKHLQQVESPEHQLSYIESESSRQGWVDTGLVYQAELTGSVIMDRPDIKRMLRDAEASLFDTVVMKSISRLGRDTLGLLMIKRLLDDLRVELIALADGYQSFRDPELIFLVHANQAQAGRLDISKNVTAGMVEVAKRGIWPAGTLPFGYQKESRTTIDLDPDTAPIAQLIFELRKQHWGAPRICHHLNTELRAKAPEWWNLKKQIARLEASDREAKDDRIQMRLQQCKQHLIDGTFLWYPKTIRTILSNTAYYGEARYNRTKGERRIHGKLVRTSRDESELVIVPCTPLVSRDEWEQVQAIGEARGKMPRRSLSSPFLLSGIISCGRCGSSMRGSPAHPGSGKRGGDPRGYYVCRGAVEAGAHESEYVRAHDLEQAVIARLRAELAPLEEPKVVVRKRPRKTVDPGELIADIEAEISDLAESRFFRREELRKARMTEAEFAFEMGLIQKKEEELNAKLEQLRHGRICEREEGLRLAAVREAAERLMRLEGSDDQVKALLATLVRKVIVHSASDVEVHTTFTPDEIATYQSAAD